MSTEIDYPLGLTGLAVTAVAYSQVAGDVVGVSLTFTENTHRLGYYTVTSSALTPGLNWFQISAGGNYFDSMWQTVPASGTVILVPSQFEGLNQVNLASGAIGFAQFAAAFLAYTQRARLITTGSTTPVSADPAWNVAGSYNNEPYYQSSGGTWFAWNNGSGWTISTAVGVNGTNYWTTAAGATVVGPYTAHGATGVPTVVAHGNSVWGAFQPDLASTASVIATTTRDVDNSSPAAGSLGAGINSILTAVGPGQGANAITVTVKDASNNDLQGAIVSAALNGSTVGRTTSNDVGVAVLTLNSGTFVLSVYLAGWNGVSQPLVVNGAAPVAIVLTPLTITPSSPPGVTGWLYCYDKFRQPIVGVPHRLCQIGVSSDGTGSSLTKEPRTVESDVTGLVQFTDMEPLAKHTIARGTGSPIQFTSDSVDFPIPDIIS